MKNRCLTPMLLVCAALGLACGSESGVEPGPSPTLTTLEVTPVVAHLFAAGPGNTVKLSLGARDQTDTPMLVQGVATYSSSNPAVARVSISGMVTAVAPGTAEITALLAMGNLTRSATMTVTVHARDSSPPSGAYHLSALIQSYDPAWGVNLDGYRYTAALTLVEKSGPPWYGGTYADLRLVGPSGDSLDVADTGAITGSIAPDGRRVIELLGNGNSIGLSLVVTSLDPGFIAGDFGCCGHISGTFTAERGVE